MSGLTIHPAADDAGAADTVIVDRYLYLTADGAHVVGEGHPDSRWLWAAPGQQVPRAEAERLGALPAGETKRAKPPANKARQPGADKSAAAADGGS